MPKAVIYCRISDRPDHAIENNQSIEAQEAVCRAKAAALGLEVFSVHADFRVSGATLERPSLYLAFEDLAKGDVLLVSRLDRISRDLLASIFIEKKVEAKGARILSCSGEGTSLEPDNPTSKFVRQILAVTAEFERAMISARTKSALRAKMLNHQKTSSKAPFGWRIVPNTKQIEPDPKTAPILEVLYHMTVQGYQYPDMRDEVNTMLKEANLPTMSGQTIQAIIERIQRSEHPIPPNVK